MTSRGIIKLSFDSPEDVEPIPVILDTVSGSVLALLGLDILHGYNLFADNVTNHLWHRVFIIEDPLEVKDMWSISLSAYILTCTRR